MTVYACIGSRYRVPVGKPSGQASKPLAIAAAADIAAAMMLPLLLLTLLSLAIPVLLKRSLDSVIG